LHAASSLAEATVQGRIASRIEMTAMAAVLCASVASMGVPSSAARASDCRAAPNSDAPEGSRWRFHMDRAQHRKCWHLQASDPSDRRPAASATPDPGPAPSATSSAAPSSTSAATWRHRPEPVSDQELQQDKTNCETKGNSGPVGAGSPEFKFYLLFSECMRTAGYELVPPDR
jgi:hypothetical protein